ncbi:MAG TPA: hypothetical protein PLC54_01745 [Spirochaetales bacterium]|nr:hypothetical protein [Spirochaetales bacterium]
MTDQKPGSEIELLYSRERRLKNASTNALFAESLHSGAKRGFFRSLVATRSLRFLLLAIGLTAVTTVIYQLSSGPKHVGTSGGFRYELQATWFDGNVYAVVLRSSTTDAVPTRTAIRIGAGTESSAGYLEAGVMEFRTRLKAEEKPDITVALVESPAGTLKLVCPVK